MHIDKKLSKWRAIKMVVDERLVPEFLTSYLFM